MIHWLQIIERNERYCSKEDYMPWYAWLILVLALGSIVGGLMLLRDTAKKLPLTEEQLKRVHERNAEMDAKDAQDK
jgi:H+/Cl- antiporter ClcA